MFGKMLQRYKMVEAVLKNLYETFINGKGSNIFIFF